MSGSAANVAKWHLATTDSVPVEYALQIGPVPSGEGLFDRDLRVPVDMADIQPGGKYYSIAKLQIRYENQPPDDVRYAQATGWLVAPDLLVTAGYCAFDHTHNLGRATEVKVFLGYNGKSSSRSVQFRRGKTIATANEWISSDTNQANNVSFVQVDTPFANVRPITYQPTTTRGNLKLGVVGYPIDKSHHGERGAQMYEAYVPTTFNLENAPLNMLEHTISTYAGQTGSPVLIQGQNVSIGTHIGAGQTKNLASVIRGAYGNVYEEYIDALSSASRATAISKNQGSSYLQAQMMAPEANIDEELMDSADEDNFWDSLKKVVKIGAPTPVNKLPAISPFLGPIGGPLSAVVGAAIGSIGSLTSQTRESAIDLSPGVPVEGPTARAILAEAALQTVLSMDHNEANMNDIFQTMKASYDKSKAGVQPVTRLLQAPLTDAAQQMQALHLSKEHQTVAYPTIPSLGETLSTLNYKQEAFVVGIQEAARSSDSEESFVTFASSITQIGISGPPPSIMKDAHRLRSLSATNPTFNNDLTPQVGTLVERAIMGEAALQAIQNIPAHELQRSGLFDKMVDGVRAIGREVVRVAPVVISSIGPAAS